jgi:folate-binding Fe-S cluster repair protein YgfZ
MAYGVLLNGNGKVWFDNLSFEIVDENTPVTDLYATKLQKKTKNLSFEKG